MTAKPYDKAVRSRRGTHLSRIIKLNVIDPIFQMFSLKPVAPRLPSNHPTMKVPTRSTHPTAKVQVREPSAPFEVIECDHTLISGDGECLWCGKRR